MHCKGSQTPEENWLRLFKVERDNFNKQIHSSLVYHVKLSSAALVSSSVLMLKLSDRYGLTSLSLPLHLELLFLLFVAERLPPRHFRLKQKDTAPTADHRCPVLVFFPLIFSSVCVLVDRGRSFSATPLFSPTPNYQHSVRTLPFIALFDSALILFIYSYEK